jgi:hypothetical protein
MRPQYVGVPVEPFASYAVPDNSPTATEQMGTKPKFWLSRDGEPWLFKASRPGTGEHWAEVIAAGLAELLGLPHAHYELATWRDVEGLRIAGVVTRNFVAAGFELVHGNELLAERDPDYPPAGKRYIRTQQHTIDAVKGVVGAPDVGPPIGLGPIPGIDTAVDVFAGYLLMDAWIGNTDRHHENWALVVDPSNDSRHLAPTFDHASSLGAHVSDEERRRRLESRDPAYQVRGYVQRSDARSALYAREGDARALPLLDTLGEWGGNRDAWLARLDSIGQASIGELIGRVPASEMSGPARAFAREMLRINKERILRTR